MKREEAYKAIRQEVRILDYAGRLGYTIVRKGRYYSLKEHDSVIIDAEKNCFWRNSKPGMGKAIGRGGSVIDFVLEFTDLPLHQVLSRLSEEAFGGGRLPTFEKRTDARQESSASGQIQLPKRDTDMHCVFAYLIQTRKIRADVVQMLVDRKQLYQDDHKNCVFISYDREGTGKPVFGCRRGTNTYRPFYGDLPGCDYEQGFYFGRGAERLYVTEGIIDALSVMSMREDADSFDYLSLAGVGKTGCIRSYLSDERLKEVWIGTDRDDAGREAAALLEEKARDVRPDIQVVADLPPEPYKDWNEYLQNRGGER